VPLATLIHVVQGMAAAAQARHVYRHFRAASATGCEADVAQTAVGWEGAAADAPGMALLAGYGSGSESQDAAEDEG
jgi:hypothetical protein